MVSLTSSPVSKPCLNNDFGLGLWAAAADMKCDNLCLIVPSDSSGDTFSGPLFNPDESVNLSPGSDDEDDNNVLTPASSSVKLWLLSLTKSQIYFVRSSVLLILTMVSKSLDVVLNNSLSFAYLWLSSPDGLSEIVINFMFSDFHIFTKCFTDLEQERPRWSKPSWIIAAISSFCKSLEPLSIYINNRVVSTFDHNLDSSCPYAVKLFVYWWILLAPGV